ncbi:hypothetical protein P363_0106070, partial [Paenibacillus sp. MAEPY1]
ADYRLRRYPDEQLAISRVVDHSPTYKMGREAAGLLIKLVEQAPIENKHIQLPVSFIERGTTRKVNSDG